MLPVHARRKPADVALCIVFAGDATRRLQQQQQQQLEAYIKG